MEGVVVAAIRKFYVIRNTETLIKGNYSQQKSLKKVEVN